MIPRLGQGRVGPKVTATPRVTDICGTKTLCQCVGGRIVQNTERMIPWLSSDFCIFGCSGK